MAVTVQEREALHKAADIIKALTDAGERVIIRDFGTFQRRDKAATTARNPKTGEKIQVPAKSVLHFKAAKSTID